MIENEKAVIALTPAADYSAKEGYFVTHDGTTATVVSSAATKPDGIILNGETTAGKVSVALQKFGGIVSAKAGGTCTAGGPAYLKSDGTVYDIQAGAATYIRVGEFVSSGVSGDLVKIVLTDPFNASTVVS